MIDGCYGHIWGILSLLDSSNTFPFANHILPSKCSCNTRASNITRNLRALALSGKTMKAPDGFSNNFSLRRKYDVRIANSSYKQYISIVANKDLKAKIEMSSLCRTVKQFNFL